MYETSRRTRRSWRPLPLVLALAVVAAGLTFLARSLDPLSNVKDGTPAIVVTFSAFEPRDPNAPASDRLMLGSDVRLADAVKQYLQERDGDVAVFLHSDDGYEMSINGGRRMRLASLAKPLILVGFLQQAEDPASSVALTDYDVGLLQDMIEYSDNDAADALISEIDAQAFMRFLSSKGIRGARSNHLSEWGDWRASPSQVASLLWELWSGKLLAEDDSDLARALLEDIAYEQRWGVTAGLDDSADIGLKNGWYEDDNGWRVHSAGIVDDGERSYVLVIMTSGNPTFEYGLETVEDLARMINTSLSLVPAQAGAARTKRPGSA